MTGKTSAVVVAANSVANTVDVWALGSTMQGLAYPAWYMPTVGDSVVIDWLGSRPYVETAFSGASSFSPGSYRSGWNYSSPHTARSTANPLVGSGGAIPFVAGRLHSWTAMICEVTAAAAAGGALRFGIYNDSGAGYPTSLLATPGAVATTSTGVQSVAFPGGVALDPGLYWLGFQVETSLATLRSVNDTVSGLYGMSSGAGAFPWDGFYSTTAAWTPGVMPPVFPASVPQVANLPFLALTAA